MEVILNKDGVVIFKDGDFKASSTDKLFISNDRFYMEAIMKAKPDQDVKLEFNIFDGNLYLNGWWINSNFLLLKNDFLEFFIDVY